MTNIVRALSRSDDLLSIKSSRLPQVHLNRTNLGNVPGKTFAWFIVFPHTEHFNASPFMGARNRKYHAAPYRKRLAFERTHVTSQLNQRLPAVSKCVTVGWLHTSMPAKRPSDRRAENQNGSEVSGFCYGLGINVRGSTQVRDIITDGPQFSSATLCDACARP